MNNSDSTYNIDISGKKSIEFVLKCINKQFQENKRMLKVLDVGCGTGQLTKIVAMTGKCQILAIDMDESSLKLAKESLKDLKNVTFRKSKVEDFSSDEKFDIILMTQVLDHISNPAELLQQCRNLIRENGQAIIGISNGYGIYEKSKDIFPGFAYKIMNKSKKLYKLKKMPYTCNRNSPHLHKFSIKDIKEILKQSDFEMDSLKKMTFILPAFPFCILYYFTPNVIAAFFESLDYILANMLPSQCSSNWYISCRAINGKLYEEKQHA